MVEGVQSKHILLVEDQAIIALSEASVLTEAGFSVEIVHSGEAAVQHAVSGADIDLILMDIDLGSGIDGTDAATRILAVRSLPIVFLTGHAEKDMVDRVKGITRYGYVLKGGGSFVLIESVTMALELYAANQATIDREHRILALNRMYAVLSDVNQAIVRTRSPDALYQNVCRIAVESGGFLFAWVGLIEEKTNILHPVAWYRPDETYVKQIVIDFSHPELGNGPAGRAFRSGIHFISNQTRIDDVMGPWRAEATARGFRASAAFPIKVFGKVIGIFSFYAGEEEFFDSDEVRLLDELAVDIGFAVETEQTEREQEQRAEAQRETEQLLQFVAMKDPNVAFAVDRDFNFLFVNDRFADRLGMRAESATGTHHLAAVDGVPQEWRAAISRAFVGETTRSGFEPVSWNGDGDQFVQWHCYPWLSANKKIVAAIVYANYINLSDLPPPADIRGQSSGNLMEREARHRFKNGMQLISSLLAIDATRTDDDVQAFGLRRAAERVSSLSTVLSTAYAAEVRRQKSDLFTVMEQLAGELRAAMAGAGVEITVKGSRVEVDASDAVPFALIVHELVMNALKHAFSGPDGRHSISVLVDSRQGSGGRLTVSDNGGGFPEALLRLGAAGDGLVIVRALTRQVGGTIELANEADNGGASVTIEFPTERSAATPRTPDDRNEK